jgi:hypothetical protein
MTWLRAGRHAAAARALLAAFAVTSLIGVVLLAQVPERELERLGDSFELSVTFVAVMAVFAVVGAVIASRAPSNPIGWLLLALALLEGIYELAYGYAFYGLTVAEPGSLPLVDIAAWVSEWSSPLSPVLLVPVLVLFPTGRPPSPRWNVLLWACLPLLAAILLHYAFQPGPLGEFPDVVNPVVPADASWIPGPASDPFILVCLLGAAASLVVRFRRARSVERQQLKWFAFAAGVMAAFLLVGGAASSILGEEKAGTESTAAGFVFAACISGIPIAVGIAILRHRLYDIDVVIRRTLVYGSLSATLAAGYLGCVLLAQLVIGAESDLAIAGSTLAMAALFRPARERIQGGVDRRFYRRRYDAAQTLEAFSSRLRSELDLEALGADLGGVVRETLQPAHVSLWLRERAS